MRLLSSKIALSCGVAAVALAWASGSWAQATNGSSGNGGMEIVTVTAERRSESVQNIAGGITALTSGDLTQMHANNFADFAATVPGVSYFSGGATSNLIAIRGVTTGGTQLGSAIGLYLDDVPIGASTQFGLGFQSLNINTFDLDRVEVLNGPQGTLYGANALGGTVKYVTAAPELGVYSGRFEGEFSDTEHGGANDGLRAMANLPLGDSAALRIDGVQEFDSGYTQDPDHDRRNVGSGRQLGGRIQFLADITPDINIRLTAFDEKVNGSGADVVFRDPFTHKPTEGTYDQSYPLAQPSENSLELYSAELNWDFHWAKLTSVTGYQIDKGQYEADESTLYDALLGGSTDPFGLPVNDTTNKFSQEVRLASPDNKHFEWVVGGYYDRESTDEGVDLVDAANPGGTLYGVLPFYGFLPSTYREYAAFGDGTYYVTSNFDVTLGIRYSEQHQTYESNLESLFFVAAGVYSHNVTPPNNQSTATYLINPRWQVSDDTMLYARVSSGFRPGGPNFTQPGGIIKPTFQPDSLWNYELGEKSTLLGDRLTLNADVYDIEWSDIQLTLNSGGINNLVNGGDARVQGAEASFAYRLIDSLTLGGTASYTDAKITRTLLPGTFPKGDSLPVVPKFNFSLVANYTVDFGDGYSGGVNVLDTYVGNRTAGYAGVTYGAGNPAYKLASYNTMNVNLAFYMPNNMEIDAYVKNLFDTQGEVSASTVTNQYVPGAPVPVYLSQPRTIGLELKVGFGP